jgi:oligopeptide transport system substrate-binding protein
LLYAHSEAIDYYQRALQVLESKNEPEQIAHTLMKMGLVYTASFHPEEAKQAYSRAFDYWDTLDLSIRRTDIDLPLNVFRMVVAIPPGLDPGRMTDDVSRFMINQLFEGLVVVDAQYNVIPAVAARWEVLDDGRCYRFHIKENLHWSDGSPLTAWDFEFAWKRNLSVSPMAHLLYVIENGRAFAEKEITDPDAIGVHALDDHVLEVQLESPTAYLPFLLAHPVAAPLPRKGVASGELLGKAPEMMVCNGPYYISEYDSTSSITLQRNPYYQGQFPGNIDRVECPFLTEFGPAFEAYAAGELDAVQMIVSDLRTMIRARQLFPDDFRLVPQLSTVFLAFRVDRPPFDDQRVRKAFVHAIDRNSIVEEASQGTYLPAVGGFIPPGMPGHSRDIGLEFNPEKAKNLLGQAGYQNGKGFPGVEWLYYGREGSQREPLIPLLRKAFRDVLGLDIHPQMINWQEFLRRRDEEPADLAVSGWFADVPDPDNFLRVTFHSTEGVSPGLWKNVEFDELVEEAHHTMDPHRRIALYKQADRLLVSDEAAIMPIMYGQGRVLAKPWVSIPQIPPALLLIKEVRIRERLVKKQE